MIVLFSNKTLQKENVDVENKIDTNEESMGDIVSKFPFDDEIILSIHWAPYVSEKENINYITNEQFKYMKDAGINLVNGVSQGDTTAAKYQQRMAEYSANNNVGFIVADWDLCGGKDNWGQNYAELYDGKKISDLASPYTKYPSVKGFYIKDEPELSTIYINAYKYLKSVAPSGYMLLNFLPYIDAKNISNVTEWLRLSNEAGYPQ